MIDFPIVDAHVHLGDSERLKYPRFKNKVVSYLPSDYQNACGPVEVERIVFMQFECDPSHYKDEVEWVTELAKNVDHRIQGIISFAPMEKGEALRPEIEALKRNPLVKGVRRLIQAESDLEFCLRPDFEHAVKMLAEYDLRFDLGMSYKQNRSVLTLLERCPDVRFIMDHIGKPNIKDGLLDPWRDEIREMAKFPNLWCKVSSLSTAADHQNWTIDDLKPYADHIFSCFGFGRTVYGGDWPVSSSAASLPACVDTLEQLVQGCSRDELKKLFHDNAISFYGL